MKVHNVARRTFLTAGLGAAASLALKPAFGQSQDLAALSMKKVGDMVRSRDVSPVELTRACLDRIERYNSSYHAFITVAREEALAAARQMEAEQQRRAWRGPLHGVPIALKDNIDTAGIRSTGASELFENRIPTEDAEVSRRLKNAGAILLGKTNLHQFAYGGSSTVTHFGTMHNPWAYDRVTSGSSGGSGVAVASDFCYGALGTDTAGSVRMPASYCGIVGLKPTYGRVSMRGVMTLSWTLDHVGPMCKTVEDAALMMNIIAGYDLMDPTTVDVPVPDYLAALRMPTSRLRLGIPRTPFYDNLDPEVAKAVETATEVLRRMTTSIQDVQLPQGANSGEIWGPEAYLWHYEGITQSPEKYQPSVRRSVEGGADDLAWQYVRTRRQVELLRREVTSVFSNVDLLVLPTMKVPPGLLQGGGAGTAAAGAASAAGAGAPVPAGAAPAGGGGGNNASIFDVFGLPAISVPCGFTASGLPIGLQIVGAHFAEPAVFALAAAYERATDWHTRNPQLEVRA